MLGYPNLVLNKKEFQQLSHFIENQTGIRMPESKKILLQSRLYKRLIALKMNSFEEYIQFIFSPKGKDEIVRMIDIVTTNKTEFFREADHFEYLKNHILPQYICEANGSFYLKCWSAGCSSGEEAYTLGIVFAEFAELNKGFDFYILGTDISTRMLRNAREGIYPCESVKCFPINIKKKYLLKERRENITYVKFRPELMRKINFQYINFNDNYYNIPGVFDIIFCRNVLIYFDREVQEHILKKIILKLRRGGYLFLGHSESIFGFDLALKQIAPTIFIKL